VWLRAAHYLDEQALRYATCRIPCVSAQFANT
jgi:hypothetical protein